MKKILSLILICCLVFISTGCEKKAIKKEEVKVSLIKEFDSKKEYTLNLYLPNENMNIPVYTAISEMSKVYPNIKVNIVSITDGNYVENIVSRNQSTDEVDIYIFDTSNIEKAYLAGVTTPIENENINEKNYTKRSIEACTYQNMLIGYPLFFSTQIMACNTKISPNIPSTFEQMKEFSNTLELGEGEYIDNVIMWNLNDVKINYNFVGNVANVGGINGDDKTNMNFNNEACINNLKYFKDLTVFYNVYRDSVTEKSITDSFSQGHLVYALLNSEDIYTIEANKVEGLQYSVSTIPNINDTEVTRSLATTYAIAVNPYSDSQSAAIKVAEYLSNEQSVNIAKDTKMFSCKNGYEEIYAPVYKSYENSILKCRLMDISDFYLNLEIAFDNILDGADISVKASEIQKYLDALFAS